MVTRPASLDQALRLAGWGPRDLGRAVNAWLQRRGRAGERIDVTAAYSWVRSGYCPHGGIPEVVASALSEQLGIYVSAEHLWPGHARARRATARVTDPAHVHTVDGLLRGLGELVDGARPLPATGADLVASVLDGLHAVVDPAPTKLRYDQVSPSQADLVAMHVGALRRLDDQQGGGALSLRYVTRELASVLDLVRSASYAPDVGHQLVTIVADLAQLTGWMQFDAGETCVAQQYLLLAVRAARAADDEGRMANTVGMLGYVAAHTGQITEAVQVVDAASQMRTSSKLLRARIAGRAATAYAAAGNLTGYQKSAGQAQDLLSAAPGRDSTPYLYYLSPDQLAAEAGHALLLVAGRADLYQRRLLDQAVELLSPLAGVDARPDYQRSALLHGCHLVNAHLQRRDLDGAVEATKVVLSRLPQVQSGRCVALLRGIRRALAQRRRSTVVADVLPELEQALEGV